MRVKCKARLGINLPMATLQPESGFNLDTEFWLVVNKYYLVYAITLRKSYIWYYLCDESYTYYPFWNPSPLFEVTDGNLSKYWVYNLDTAENNNRLIISYPEWANDPYYYNRLSDGEIKDVNIFKKYKYLMDLEFSDPSIKEKASELDNTWLLCPFCIDAWESKSTDGMVICPRCKNILHNPRYQQQPSSFLKGIVFPEVL